MSKYKFISKLSVVVLAIAMVSCKSSKKLDHEIKETETLPEDVVEMRADQQKLAGIELGAIEYRSLSGTLKVSGVIAVAPQNLATVCMPMGGFVKSTSLLPGNAVSKGQVLAILESQEYVDVQQNYLEARNRFEYAEAEYKRQSELFKNDVSSQKNLQEVTSNYKSLKAQVKALEQKLALIGINPARLREDNISSSVPLVSPIKGDIKSVNINMGKYVAPSDVLFEIVNSDKLLLELTLFEKDADKASVGQKIRFFINNETEQHEAVIYQTGKSVNSDKTYKVYATITGECKNTLPGMYVNAIVETSENKAASLPSEAVVSFEDKDYIFVFDKNKKEGNMDFTEFKMVEVKKGVTDGMYTEVTLPGGIDVKNIKVVVKGAYNLLSAKKNAGEMAC